MRNVRRNDTKCIMCGPHSSYISEKRYLIEILSSRVSHSNLLLHCSRLIDGCRLPYINFNCFLKFVWHFFHCLIRSFIVAPLEVVMTSNAGTDNRFSAERPYTVECRANGSVPLAKITWWKNDQLVDHSSVIVSSRLISERSDMVF